MEKGNEMHLIKVNIKSLLIFLILFFSALNINCNKNKGESAKDLSLANLDTVAVKVSKTSRSNIAVVKTYTGTLEGEDQANIVSKIPERITNIKVSVGDKVTVGQLLITLDKSGASSQFYQAQAGFLNAERDMNRMKALYEEGAISQQMYDGTKTAYEIAKANFDAAKNSVELTSPINGIVTAINPNVGDLANPGMVLMTIASINRMKVLFNAGEADIPNFAIGQPAEIFSELKPDLIQKGKVSQISKSADIQSRSFEVRAAFQNTYDKWFKPGMFCRVNVELKTKKNILIVPVEAVLTNQNITNVYVVKDGRAYSRKVETGISNGKITEILSGLQKDETVVTLGTNNLKEGSVVHISE
jgi:RND family efflux transporter MFP subunit